VSTLLAYKSFPDMGFAQKIRFAQIFLNLHKNSKITGEDLV